MTVDRHPISVSQISELLGIEPPRRFVAVEHRLGKWYVVTEGDMAQTSGTFPALSNNTAIRKPKKGKRR